MANVKGKVVVFKLSADGGTTKKILVCLSEHGFSASTEIASEQSMCDDGATISAAGAKSWEMTGTGFVKKGPAVGEVSYNDLLGWWNASTDLWAEMTDPDSTFYHAGAVIISKLDLRNAVNGSSGFTITLTGNGALDITA